MHLKGYEEVRMLELIVDGWLLCLFDGQFGQVDTSNTIRKPP